MPARWRCAGGKPRWWPTLSEHANLPTARHEASDVAFRPLLIGGVGVLALAALLAGLVGLLYPGTRDPRLVRSGAVPQYPAPALQPDPAADMARFRAQQLDQLNGVWWVDRAAGAVHQPIADAMRRLAAQGIADWPATPVRAQPTPQARTAR